MRFLYTILQVLDNVSYSIREAYFFSLVNIVFSPSHSIALDKQNLFILCHHLRPLVIGH